MMIAYQCRSLSSLSTKVGRRGGRQQQQHTTIMPRLPQQYDYFLILDFEATCDRDRQPKPQEIIEFPVLKVNATTYEVESIFHKFVRPTKNPVLTNFCTDLTTITQADVNGAQPFPEVLREFDQWMREKVGLNHNRLLFVTCGDWDLKTMLPSQCATEHLQVPPYCKTWLNIKKSYAMMTGEYVKGMMPMISGLHLQHIGTEHRGLDDCENLANILRALADKGCKFMYTMKVE